MQSRQVFVAVVASLLLVGSVGCNTLTHPDEIVIAPEPKRAAAAPSPPAPAAAPAAPAPHPGGAAPPSGG